MSFSVNTNAESLAAIRLLNMTNSDLNKTQERINSGYKINSAKDNASTFAIAKGMNSDINSFASIADTLNMGQAVANVALTAAETVLDKLTELQQEVVKAQDPTANRTMIQESINSIVSMLQGTVDAAQFNGVNLLNNTDGNLAVLSAINRTDPTTFSTASITVQAEDLRASTLGVSGLNISQGYAQVAFGTSFIGNLADHDVIDIQVDTDGDGTADSTTTFEFVDDLAADALNGADHVAVDYSSGTQGGIVASFIAALRDNGFTASYNDQGQVEIAALAGDVIQVAPTGLTVGAIGSGNDIERNVVAAGNPTTAITTVENAMTAVKAALSRLGASANSLETQSEFVGSLKDTLETGVGQLIDANMAEESAKLQALQTKRELGLQALSIANQQPSSVLKLFQ